MSTDDSKSSDNGDVDKDEVSSAADEKEEASAENEANRSDEDDKSSAVSADAVEKK